MAIKIDPQNIRIKFINDALNLIYNKKGILTEWEYNFFIEINNAVKTDYNLTTHQYNTLMDIYGKFNKCN
jgi:hypothetical protein